jgi:hypothetical protein
MDRAALRRLAIVVVPGAFAVLVAALIVAVLLDEGSTGDRDPAGPRIGDHWHAPYAILIDGARLPAIPEVITTEGLHTHGDGVIHIHPHLPGAEGSGASLADFFSAMGGELTDTELRLPGDSNPYRDGTITGDMQNGFILNEEVLRLRLLRADSGIHPLGAGFAEASRGCNDKPESQFDQVDPDYVAQDGDCIRIVFGPVE